MINPVFLASVVGLTAGVAGVVIAFTLQVLTEEYVAPRYVFGFFAVGSALILMNLSVTPLGAMNVSEWIAVIGNVVLLLVEVAAFIDVRRRAIAVYTPDHPTDGD